MKSRFSNHLVTVKGFRNFCNFLFQESRLLDTGLAIPDGIAVDWVGKMVYFAESAANRIEVIDFEGKMRAPLISVNLTTPRGLSLDPRVGYLFITDWGGSPKILRSRMDGSELKVLVTKRVGWPNGITIDYADKIVYWVDARYDYIDAIDYNGQNRRTILRGVDVIPHPFALSILDDYIYVTDWILNGIVKIHKRTNSSASAQIILKNLSRPMDIQVISQQRQPSAENPCNNSGCKQLCVIKSSNEFSCLCQANYKLSSDNRSCERHTKFLLFARSWEVRGISLDENHEHDAMVPVLGLKSAVGIDYDALNDYVYFSDVKADKIGRVKIGQARGSPVEWIITDNLQNPDGLAVDWIGGNLYWTDSKLKSLNKDKSEIAVSKLDGSYRKTLLQEPLGKPRAIVVYPQKG